MTDEEKYVRYFAAAMSTFDVSYVSNGGDFTIAGRAHGMARAALQLDPFSNARNSGIYIPPVVSLTRYDSPIQNCVTRLP